MGELQVGAAEVAAPAAAPRKRPRLRARRPRRVALVTEYYYPHLGGVTEHVHNLALQLAARGDAAVVITPRLPGRHRDDPFVRRVGRSAVIFKNGSFARLAVGWRLQHDIEAILRRERIDLVHVHGALTPTLGIVAPAAAHRLRLPVVGTFHSWFRESIGYRAFRAPLQRRLDRYAALIAVSEPVVEAHSRYFRGPWEIIPNGVDVEVFRPNDGAAPGGVPGGAAPRAPRLLFLGRLDPRNGLETVLSAMPRILRRHPSAELVVVGDGPLARHYRRLAAPLGAGVRFAGRVLEERPGYFGAADLYLCPTTRASFGITLLESMACGTPMIVSDIQGFRELVNGGGEARLAPPGDPGAWADAVLDLLADPARRALMGAAGRAKALEFAWPRVADRVFGIYERVLG